jgi:DNA-binding FadR family transcriptional regulator
LVTQVVLAILSDDLTPGQRLPSTRDLARRFRLHPNTVSAGYRELAAQGWLEHRHGSGVYVRNRKKDDGVSPAPVVGAAGPADGSAKDRLLAGMVIGGLGALLGATADHTMPQPTAGTVIHEKRRE